MFPTIQPHEFDWNKQQKEYECRETALSAAKFIDTSKDADTVLKNAEKIYNWLKFSIFALCK